MIELYPIKISSDPVDGVGVKEVNYGFFPPKVKITFWLCLNAS